MIGISKLLCGSENFGDSLRYHQTSGGQRHGAAQGKGPVVVWNMTRTCNLKCRHCYSESETRTYEGELTTDEAMGFIDDLAAFHVPVLLFSGGEPLIRPDFFTLAMHTVKRGIRATISTNGTLIDQTTAKKLKEIGVGYAGISIDGIGERNDMFRGKKGAFEEALKGIRYCLAVKQRVGLRFTINKHNINDLEDIFYLLEEEGIPRVCFYHLVYSGRGSDMMAEDISPEETREAMDMIMDKTVSLHKRGKELEVLTVDNHCDAIYLYMKVAKESPEHAEKILELLRRNGGNRTGIAIGEVDWCGDVHADQFTRNHTFGNVRQRKFGDIWTDVSHPILAGLKNRRNLLSGRCATCQWLDICNGNFRARAEAVFNDFWASDPACYLTDEEIGKEGLA